MMNMCNNIHASFKNPEKVLADKVTWYVNGKLTEDTNSELQYRSTETLPKLEVTDGNVIQLLQLRDKYLHNAISTEKEAFLCG